MTAVGAPVRDILAALDVKLTRRPYADMDHYLIYRAPERWSADLTAWMAGVDRP